MRDGGKTHGLASALGDALAGCAHLLQTGTLPHAKQGRATDVSRNVERCRGTTKNP
jgi:hypothetical protein